MNNLQKILVLIAGIIAISAIIIIGTTVFQDQPTNDSTDNDDTRIITDEVIAASVNGVNITYDEVVSFQQAYAQQGQNLTEKQILEQLINAEILTQAAQQDKYIPDEQEAEQQLEALLLEQNMTLEAYKQQLKSQGTSYDVQLQKYILQLTIQNYLDDVLDKEDLNVTKQEAENYYQSYVNQSSGEVPSYEDIEDQIISYLKEQKRNNAVNALVQDLRKDAEIIYH